MIKNDEATTVATARVVRDGLGADIGASRKVPVGIARRLLFNGPWSAAAFTMAAALMFLPKAELITPLYDRVGTATIVEVSKTNSEDFRGQIYLVDYTFVDDNGVAREDRSYSHEKQMSGTADVEYVADDPSESRIVGTRARPFGWSVLLVVLFPLVLLAKCLLEYNKGERTVRLLRHGVTTHGTLVGRTTEIETSGDSETTIHVLTFEYPVRDGTTHRVTIRTPSPDRLIDDALEPMIYDPNTPDQAMPLDDLPGSPRITDSTIHGADRSSAVHLLILPLATLGFAIATAVSMIIR